MERKWNQAWRQVVGLSLIGVLSIGVGCSDPSSSKTSPQAKQPDASKPKAGNPDAKPSETASKPEPTDSDAEQTRDSAQRNTPVDSQQPSSNTASAAPDSGPALETEIVTTITPKKMAKATQVNPNITPLGRTAPSLPTGGIPEVLLTDQHKALCFLKASDTMPEIQLPNMAGEQTTLSSLYGEKLTVVCFWKGDRAFARQQLAELTPDVANAYSGQGVNVVAVAVKETPESAAKHTEEAGSEFPVLIDSDGQAFAQVGEQKLPRTYLLDANGKILWFDIEYSRSTRRELQTAIRSVVGEG